MAFPASTNVDGSNPGPNYANLPDTTQTATGNLWKIGTFAISITPSALTTGPSISAQTFASTGIGLLTTDRVVVNYPATQTANVGMLDAYVSAADTLAIKFICSTGTPTPAAGSYYVTVFRQQPNWTAPASGSQIDW